MHRLFSIAAVVLLMLCPTTWAAPPALIQEREGSAPIRPNEVLRLFKQCSRSTPQFDGTPKRASPQDIEKLERALPEFIKQQQGAGLRAPKADQAYRGQYAEFKRNGVVYIYGAYFPATYGVEVGLKPDGTAVVVCDGGASFWGVVYEPGAARFTQLEINGWP